jgi:hypothetical protein
MNFSITADQGLDPVSVKIIGWVAVVAFLISVTIFLTRLQKLLNIPV